MDDPGEVPRQAIAAFERVTGLSVAVHDLSGLLANHLSPRQMAHETPACLTVKAACVDRCIAFCQRTTRAALRADPRGRIQVCHAGLLEFVVGHGRDGGLDWVLFAGQRLPGRGLAERAAERSAQVWRTHAPSPRAIAADEAATLLELTRQLAARLAAWQATTAAALPAPADAPPHDLASRRLAILTFIRQRHHRRLRLRDLAEHLRLSEDRAGHAVREACGRTFIALLAEARLETASALLRHTELSAAQVARSSGFGDLSHFHHLFRHHARCSPLAYRARSRRRRGI